MKQLEGFRTILVAVLSIIGVVAGKYGFDFPVDDQAELVTYIMGIAMIGMRLITKKPPGNLSNRNELRSSVLSALLAIVVVLLAGCSQLQGAQPETPRQAIAAAYTTIDSLADGVRIAKRDGHIDDARRDELVEDLETAMQDVANAEQALSAFEANDQPRDRDQIYTYLSQAEATLSLVETLLQESQRE